MHEYTPEAAQAIESRQRQFTHKLMVDWNNNGNYDHPLSDMSQYVTRTSRDQAISSTAPEELMLIEGFGSASLQIEVAGEFRNLPLTGQFAAYNGRSVFYTEGIALGVSMYYEIAVWTDNGWEWYRQFTGVVREVEADRAAGIVRIDCLDNVEHMRSSMSVHAYGSLLRYLQDGYKRGTLVDSSSIIDLAARSGGFTMGPKPGIAYEDDNRQRILSVPFHGSILPERGQLDEHQEFHLTESWEDQPEREKWAEAYVTGPHGYLALNGTPSDRYSWGVKKFWLTEATPVGVGLTGTNAIGCWIRWDGAGTIVGDCKVVVVNLQRNEFRLIVREDGYVGGQIYRDNDDGTFTPYNTSFLQLPGEGWHYIETAFQHHSGEGVQGRVRVNDNRGASSTIYSGDLVYNNYELANLVTVNNWLPVSDLEVTRSTWYQDINNTSKDSIEPIDTAVVSTGRNRIMYTLRDSSRPAWDIAKEVAAAEYGVVWFDEHGRFRFWNFEDVSAQTSSIQRFFDISHVEGLNMRTTMDSVRNSWTVTTRTGYAKSGIFYDLSDDGEPWGTSDNNAFPAVDTELRKVNFNPYGPNRFNFYYVKAEPNLVCPNPYTIPTLVWNYEWDQYSPIHGKKVYQGGDYIGDQGSGDQNGNGLIDDDRFYTEQKWIRRDLVRMSCYVGPDIGSVGFWLEDKNQGRFRMKGTLVYEDDPTTWTISTSSVAEEDGETGSTYGQSIERYGERVIELGDNFWLQDEFQTKNMLKAIVKKFGRPTPVTDNITVAGDPRVQIGDVIEINDWEGMGANIRLQIYGITRELEDGVGLTDTYQVEVVEVPGIGRWDDESYGIWDQSFIWS